MSRRTIIALLLGAAGASAPVALASAPGRSAAGSGLPISRASSRVVQAQPAAGSCHARGRGPEALPDRLCTPGAIDPAATQSDLVRTICRSGYSASVRPAEAITQREKRASMVAYGDRGSMHEYEYDHLVALELGGARNDARNLWPEPGASPNVKDRVEDRLHALVCAGTISLAAAQRAIALDWLAADRRYVG